LLGTGPFVLAFDLTTNQQLLQEKILVESVVHGFEARKFSLVYFEYIENFMQVK